MVYSKLIQWLKAYSQMSADSGIAKCRNSAMEMREKLLLECEFSISWVTEAALSCTLYANLLHFEFTTKELK